MESKIKKIILLFVISLILVPTVIFAGTMNSAKIPTTKTDLKLKKISVAPKTVEVEVGTSEKEVRRIITVYAYYKGESEPKVVENYITNYNNIKEEEGSQRVRIEYTENGCTKCTTLCVILKGGAIEENSVYIPYVSGYPDGTFRADSPVTRGEFASMIANLLTDNKVPEEKNIFTDVSDTSFGKDAINYVAFNNIMKPITNDTFEPQAPVTSEVAKQVFENVEARIQKQVPGIDVGTGDLTRGEAVQILNKLFDIDCNISGLVNPFSDLTTSSPYYKDIICVTRKTSI